MPTGINGLNNIHYVSVSSRQFNERDSLQLNLTFSQTVHLTAVKVTLTSKFNGHWFYLLRCKCQTGWMKDWVLKGVYTTSTLGPKSEACSVFIYDISMHRIYEWLISKYDEIAEIISKLVVMILQSVKQVFEKSFCIHFPGLYNINL